MVDGDEDTYAEDNETETQFINRNTCDGTDLGAITKVELRAKFKTGLSTIELTPNFIGGDGTAHDVGQSDTRVWSDWIDITSDTNAPVSWAWSDVVALDCWVIGTFDTHTYECSQVEIRVSYNG